MTGPGVAEGDDDASPVISPRQSVNPQSPVEVGTTAAADGPPPSKARRAVTAAATARDRTIGQLVALLVPLIRATRYPTLAVVLLAAVPALVEVVVALLRAGPDDPFWLFLAAVGLLLAGWLAYRRRQLLDVAKDPAALADALSSVVTGRDIRDQLVRNLSAGRVGAAVRGIGRLRRSRPLRILGGLWRGVQLTGVLTKITDRPELAPLLPGRLRGIWFLGIACLIASLVLGVAVVVTSMLFLLGA